MIKAGALGWTGPQASIRAQAGARLSPSWMVALVAGSLGLVPLFVVRMPPLEDWPSHLARVQILAEMLAGPSPWSRFYEVRSFLLPDVVLEAVVLPLMKLGLGIDAAGRVFLLLLYAMFVGGFVRLASAFGAGGPLKLILGALLFYNGSLFYGLVNFQFGLGLAMLLAGSWYRSELLGRLALAALGTVAVFECHLVAAFLYAGILGSLDCHALWTSRGRSLFRSTGVVAAGVTVLLLLLSPTGHDGFHAVWDGADSFSHFVMGKAELFAKTLLGGSVQSDIVFVAGGAVVAAVAAFGCRLRLPWPVLAVVAATGIVTVAAPAHLGAGSLLDYRIALVPWLLLGAGLAVSPRKAWTRHLLLGLMAALLLARITALTWSWRAADAEFAALDAVMAKLPRDSALLVGRGRLGRDVPWAEFWAYPYNTVPTDAVRYDVFVPSVYAHPAQQPLVLKPAYRDFNDFEDVSTPALLDQFQHRPEMRALCQDFPAGVAMIVLFPTEAGLPGMARVGSRFGRVNMCGDRPQ